MRNLRISGEIGNFTRAGSGHCYFTLKDTQAQLSAVMFRGAFQENGYYDFKPGDQVVATGSITVYAARGVYQLKVDRMELAGQGVLYAKFLEIKEKLQAAGLFAQAHKRTPVPMPQVLAAITSATGAVLHDIQTTLQRRYPYAELWLFPAVVQGAEALPSLLNAFQAVEEHPAIDTVLLARGGGSMEDLWCFNEEKLAHAIYNCSKPVISAIGHETDFTIADFVADLRAPTPTAAAELAAIDRQSLQQELQQLQRSLEAGLQARVQFHFQRLDDLKRQLADALRARQATQERNLQQEKASLFRRAERLLSEERQQLAVLAQQLESLNVEKVLKRGYTLTLKDDKLLRSPGELLPGQAITTQFADGQVHSTVQATVQAAEETTEKPTD